MAQWTESRILIPSATGSETLIHWKATRSRTMVLIVNTKPVKTETGCRTCEQDQVDEKPPGAHTVIIQQPTTVERRYSPIIDVL